MPLSGMLHTRAIAILVKPFQIKPPQTLWCMVVFTFNPGKFKSLPVQVLLDLRMKLQVLFIVLSVVSIRAEFVLTVNFINYTNPTGLCAECGTRLEDVTSADQLTPVCCDELPFRSDNCDNIGGARCDTRFRWIIRPFGASLETRPVAAPGAAVPPYYFTDCNLPGASCPFSEMSTTFDQGPTGFLGVEDNPLTVDPRDLTSWTGRVQFFIQAVHSGLPNIIDSLLINLDNLQLGADFTEEMTFTGYHNISRMTMSFRIECAPGYCGPDCTAASNNPHVLQCRTNGEVVCSGNRSPNTGCSGCLHNYDLSTNCTQCLSNHDPSTDCSTCLFGYTGENCQFTEVAIVGGVTGGVMGIMTVVILTMAVVIFVMKKSKNQTRQEIEPKETIQMKQNPVYDVTTAGPPQPSTADTDAIQLQPNILYGVSTEPDRGDQTIY